MRTLLALDNFSRGSGGAAASAQELAGALLARGHEVLVIESARAAGGELWRGARIERVRLHGPLLPADRDLRTLVLNPRWRRAVGRAIAGFRPEIVLAQGMLAPGALEAARAAEIPSAYFFRGYAPCCPEQYVGLSPEECTRPDCRRCLGLMRRLKWPLGRAALELYDRAIPQADLVVANSRYVAGLFERFWKVNAEVVYPTLRLEVSAAPENDPNGWLLFVKPQAAKGLEVFAAVAAGCPERQFAVAGEVRGEARRVLERLPNVRLLGWRQDMDRVYRGARLLLGPSRLPEPFGRVFAEAASCGCPAIAFRAGGIPEAVGAGGVLLPREAAAEDWVRAIRALDDPGRYDELRGAALDNARRLAAEGGAERLVALIEAAARRGARPAPEPPRPGRKLKIVHVISALPLGGAELSLYEMVSRVDRNLFEQVVVCIREEGEMAGRFRAAGVPVIFFKLPSRYSPRGLLGLARLLARERADIVRTHMRRPNTSGRIAAWLADVPVIIAQEHNPGPDKNRRHFLVDRWLARISDSIIAVTAETAERNSRLSGIALERFVILPNGVDLNDFAPADRAAARARLKIPPEEFVVGFAGRLHPVKNVEVILRAAARAAQEVPGLRLLLAGEGEERPKLEALVAELDLAGRVTFLGARGDMPQIYPAIDVMCLASSSEGCPRVLLEAAACAIPLVSTPVGFAPEIVGRSGEAGLLVRIGDADEMAAAFARLAREPETRARMARTARERAMHYDINTYVRRMERFYFELWAAHGSRVSDPAPNRPRMT